MPAKRYNSVAATNDQVAVDIKLYLKEELGVIKGLVLQLFDLLIELSNTHADKLIRDIPICRWQCHHLSDCGLVRMPNLLPMIWKCCRMICRNVTDKNKLGSGAGYGSSFPLNRTRTTALLGLSGLHYNSVYAQMSRGKTEKFVATGIAAIAATLSKLSMDACLYNSQNLAFISFPEELTTGSSIMPHKKNPDVFELIRGRCNRIQAVPNELTLLINNLPSGYHRDMQLTKEVLFPAIESLKACIKMAILMLENIQIKDGILDDERYKYIFTVEKLNDLVAQGMPFRDAYRQVGNEVNDGTFSYSVNELHHTHEGSIGNLCNDLIAVRMAKFRNDV